MQYVGGTIIVVLAVALLLAVAWVAFHLGRIVIGIIHDARLFHRTLHQFRHPDFGTLTFEQGLWHGQIQRDARAINFKVAGIKSSPDATLIERLHAAILNLPELERRALEFTRSQEPEVRPGEFTFKSLDFLWGDKPDVFALEFSLTDDDGIWRVEFEAGRPKSVGRDD
jgi:hypothetical protein